MLRALEIIFEVAVWIQEHAAQIAQIARWWAELTHGVTNIKRWQNDTDQELEVWKFDGSNAKANHYRIPPGDVGNGEMWIPWADNAAQYQQKHAVIAVGGQPLAYIWQSGDLVRFNVEDKWVDGGYGVPGAAGAGGERTLVVIKDNNGRTGFAIATGTDAVVIDRNKVFPQTPANVKVQPDWRYCVKCQVLFWTGGPLAGGVCSDHPATHVASTSNYQLSTESAASRQGGWWFCHNCDSLFFTGNKGVQKGGKCNNGGAHDGTGSSEYHLIMDHSDAQGQNEWWFCQKCQCVFWTGNAKIRNAHGCPAGGDHDGGPSSNYTIRMKA